MSQQPTSSAVQKMMLKVFQPEPNEISTRTITAQEVATHLRENPEIAFHQYVTSGGWVTIDTAYFSSGKDYWSYQQDYGDGKRPKRYFTSDLQDAVNFLNMRNQPTVAHLENQIGLLDEEIGTLQQVVSENKLCMIQLVGRLPVHYLATIWDLLNLSEGDTAAEWKEIIVEEMNSDNRTYSERELFDNLDSRK